MKTLLLLTVIVFCLSSNSLASPADTTFKAVINDGNNPADISVVRKQFPVTETNKEEHPDGTVTLFFITVNGKTMSDTLPYDDSFGVEIIDIDKKDKFKEIMIYSGGSPDYNFWIYKYSNGLILLAKTEYIQEFIHDGSGTLTGVEWKGFCTVKDTYKLSKDGNKLEKVPLDFYPIKYTFDEDGVEKDYVVTAVKSFNIYKERTSGCKVSSKKVGFDTKYTVSGYDEKAVVTEIKKGEKVILTGYDTKYTTIRDSENMESWWVWIQVKSASGKKGWIFMNSYDQFYWNEFFEGVVFAG